jgi:LmbE family N-acetylglucosaminyl deacetylase
MTTKKSPKPKAPSRRNFYRGLLVFIAIVLCSGGVLLWYAHNSHVTNVHIASRNQRIVDALHHHPTVNLVGQAQRLLPLKKVVGDKQRTISLVSCTPESSSVLKGMQRGTNYRDTSFAYVLTYDHLIKDEPSCSLSQIIKAYGRPNASILIAGTFSQPNEMLLVYDKGSNKSSPATLQLPQGPATVVPALLSQLPVSPDCVEKTVVNIVAHQDDDLLFLSPDLLHDTRSDKCVRTIYLTAGDAGRDQFYWLSREQGSESAYSYMTLVSDDVWTQRIVKLADQEYATIATPKNNPKVSLIFMHLPDGNFDGSGFKSSKNESIAKLAAGKIKSIESVDAQSSYTSVQLTTALTSLVSYYKPVAIRTQSAQVVLKGSPYYDHSDHVATGMYAESAYRHLYGKSGSVPLYAYHGYPIHPMAGNLAAADVQEKENTFLRYAKYDRGVCQSVQDCATSTTYGLYLKREYLASY